MSDPRPPDSLIDRQSDEFPPTRVHYALGTLLGVDDFRDEQDYHRGRLARVLAYLFGAGTVAGLKLSFVHGDTPEKDELRVDPGLAIDAFGRLLEVPRRRCIRIKKWFDAQVAAKCPVNPVSSEQGKHVIAWLFIRAHPCASGRTPVLAEGPSDASNATAPARTREDCELQMWLEDASECPRRDLDLASRKLQDVTSQEAARWIQDQILAGWGAPASLKDDLGWLLLGRVEITLTAENGYAGGATPDNYQRPFVYGGWALALAAGLPSPKPKKTDAPPPL